MKTQEWKQDLCSNLFEWELTHEIIPSKKMFNCEIMIFSGSTIQSSQL